MKNVISVVATVVVVAAFAACLQGCGKDKDVAQTDMNNETTKAVEAAKDVVADAAVAGDQKKCPIMGNPISKSLYVDHEGKRVYFCCGGCPARFKADPEKYIKKMEADGVVLEKTPK